MLLQLKVLCYNESRYKDIHCRQSLSNDILRYKYWRRKHSWNCWQWEITTNFWNSVHKKEMCVNDSLIILSMYLQIFRLRGCEKLLIFSPFISVGYYLFLSFVNVEEVFFYLFKYVHLYIVFSLVPSRTLNYARGYFILFSIEYCVIG